ncbi:MAG TPA: MBL fold metallo-hydrolase [Caulobacteraceae bacterium]|nr:MBL fold metallo-hydrolase [Caulobacteraceae bacterium]
MALNRRHFLILAGPAAAAGLALSASAQPAAAPPARQPAPLAPVTIKPLKPGLYMVTGGGGNSTVRVTADAVIVVDGKNNAQPVYDALLAQIRTVTDKPVKYLFVTHHHPDHSGNNQRFLDAGAQVIGSDDLKTIIATYTPNANQVRSAAPTVTFAREYRLAEGGAVALGVHDRGGHTGGDMMVYFPDLKAVAVGDQLVDATPNVDNVNGGSVLGWQHNLGELLKLDFDVAVPGHGDEPMTKAEVAAFKRKVDTFVERARAAVKAGTPKDQLMAAIKTDDLGWNVNAPPWTTQARLDRLFAELSN